MAISKGNLLKISQHHFYGFHKHTDLLNKYFRSITSDDLTLHDVDKIKVSLSNMKQCIENIESYIDENQQVPGLVK